jgi:hypothetical protein
MKIFVRFGGPGSVPCGGGGQQGHQAPQHGTRQAEARQDQPRCAKFSCYSRAVPGTGTGIVIARS